MVQHKTHKSLVLKCYPCYLDRPTGGRSMPDFPALSQGAVDSLRIIFRQLSKDKTYLDNAPYPPETVSFLKSIVVNKNEVYEKETVPVTVEQVLEDLKSPEQWLDIAVKVRTLYDELEGLRNTDPGEQIQIIKAKAGLLERLVSAGDKALGHKQTAEHFQLVHQLFDEVLDQDQKDKFMARLREFI